VWIETVDGKHYLAEVRRKRVEFPDMIRLIEGTASDWIARGYPVGAILVEDAANGTPYLQQRKGLAPAPLIRIPKPSADGKVRRFDAVTPMFEAGEVILPRRAAWLPDYEDEVLAFPSGTFSDQVDMTSQYLAWARGRGSGRYGTRRLIGARNA
jgi:predicted phage terminase large subunit-like protein